MSLKDFEEQLLTDACKLEPTRAIGDGIFKGKKLRSYNCGGVKRDELVTDGSRLFKYAILMDAGIFRNPRIQAEKRDQDMRFQGFTALFVAAENVPKVERLNVLKAREPQPFDISLDEWERCIRLGVPTSSTMKGYTYSCAIEGGDTVRFSVAPEGTYLKEKSLRIRGEPLWGSPAVESSGPDVFPQLTGPRDCSKVAEGMSIDQSREAMGQKADQLPDLTLIPRNPNGFMGMGMPIRGYGLERKEFVGNLEKGFTYWYVSLSCALEISPRTARVSRIRRQAVFALTAAPKGTSPMLYIPGRVPGLPTPEWAVGRSEVEP